MRDGMRHMINPHYLACRITTKKFVAYDEPFEQSMSTVDLYHCH